MQTVVETPSYLATAGKLFSEKKRADIVAMIAADPECGDVMPGTGGFRKVRGAREDMGKSGGARVVVHLAQRQIPGLSRRGLPEKPEGQFDEGRAQRP